ncbi:MAG TPA: glycerol-3-phosphate dehydrogenase subunit GlpB [Chloroflexaceae bacterium]|nr:glycerol-3-phosphate dehydrogenase subunit GlpB [Chloroflexaceae bacterium]
MNYDTIVIGAGLAGLMAGLVRAERGERVLVLAKGHGATHWSSGCVDVIDGADDPMAAVAGLAEGRPDHPYALVGASALEGGLARLRAACEAAGYPLAGSPGRTLQLPTAVGALRPTSLVPATMAAGESRQLGDGRPTLIAGLREVRDFFPPLIAANLRAQGYAAEGVYLELPPGGRRREFGPMIFARLFEQPAFREQIGAQLAALVKRGGYARVGLPSILGLHRSTEVVRDLQARSGALVFEIPTLPTSVPGARLFHALQDALVRAGGRVQIGSWVLRGEGSGGELAAVYSEAAAREQRHTARRWVLATGGIVGGGLRAEPTGELRETALGLPVRAPSGRGEWFAQRFLDEGGHQIFKSGVAADERLRPLDAGGRVVYENVAVAGSALAGFDPIREGCLEGVAVATGFAAGQL